MMRFITQLLLVFLFIAVSEEFSVNQVIVMNSRCCRRGVEECCKKESQNKPTEAPTTPTTTTAATTTTLSESGCTREEFDCGNYTCISKDKKCDNVTDCPDGSDETNCIGCPYTQGNTTCAIAFDNSRSMGQELAALKVGVKKIADDLHNNPDMDIDNYVLAKFGEEAQLVVDTEDVEVYKAAVDAMSLEGRNEWIMKGIQIVAENALDNSYIYVFTDEPVGDPLRYNNTLQMVKTKNMHVVFILTDKGSIRNYDLYNKMALETGGIVLKVNENNLSPLFNYIASIFILNRNILMRVAPIISGADLDVVIDKTLSNFMVTFEGADYGVTVTTPNGPYGPLQPDDIIFKYTDSMQFKITAPAPGVWTVRVSGSSTEYSVGITADSTWYLQYGFSPNPIIGDICDTYRNPIRSTVNYIFLKQIGNYTEIQSLTEIEYTFVRTMVRFGHLPFRKTLTLVPGTTDLYRSESFSVGTDHFDIKVFGIDTSGNDVERGFESIFRPTY